MSAYLVCISSIQIREMSRFMIDLYPSAACRGHLRRPTPNETDMIFFVQEIVQQPLQRVVVGTTRRAPHF